MPLLEMASRDRRLLLAQLVEVGDRWALSASYDLPGAEVLEAARAAGLEGVVAKRAGSPYLPGRRSADWVKLKLLATQEVVIGGWTEGKGSRAGRFGALLVGVPGPEGPARRAPLRRQGWDGVQRGEWGRAPSARQGARRGRP